MQTRVDGRQAADLRPIKIEPEFFRKNDVLVSYGNTRVLCYASIEERVPQWLLGAGSGWLTAEYSMLPSAGEPRQSRERNLQSGRTQEIQRLIGRSLRAALHLELLPPVTLRIDCDVIVADGGTRTASVTGAMVALCNLLHQYRSRLQGNAIKTLAAGVSAGIVKGLAVLDLNYVEDRDAEVDANIVGLSMGGFAEVQATNEMGTFSGDQLDQLLTMSAPALGELFKLQRDAIKLDLAHVS